MLKINLQFFGGRGASSGSKGYATGGANPNNISNRTSMISERGNKPNEVDDALKVLREVQGEYGVIVNDLQIAKMSGADKNGTLAFYDAGGNLAVNENYFDLGKLNQSYDEDVQAGFHPSRGNKSAMEAVVAHEMGHRLTDEAGNIAGNGFWSLDKTSNDIVSKASKTLGISHGELRSRISGYAKSSNAETVAEAFADMYCNGNNASSASRAVINELSKYFD